MAAIILDVVVIVPLPAMGNAERESVLDSPSLAGGLRAVMIEGPSREAIELVEIK